MAIFCVALAKGGSTKTTTAAEIIWHQAHHGRRVLGIDLDQQGNLSTRMGITGDTQVTAVSADLITGEATAHEAAVPAPSVPGADIIAGTQALASTEQLPEISASLRDYLPSLETWDDIVIDTPPALGVLTLAALAAATDIIAPVTTSAEAFEQVGRLERFITTRVIRLAPTAKITSFIPTRYDGRRLIDREIVEELTTQHGVKVTPTVREGVVAKDSYTSRQPVSGFDPTSGVANDYDKAITHLTNQLTTT